MNIAVIGTGYVGLVTGTCLAEMGNTVICVDKDQEKINRLEAGEIPIYEPGLDELVLENASAGRLAFTTSLKQAMSNSNVLFIAVGTPPGEDGSADLSYVLAVAKEIGQHLNEYAIIVDKSTVPVGTGEKVEEAIVRELTVRGLRTDFDVVSNPEFLKEGAAVNDFMKPDRIIVGSSSDRAIRVMRELYSPFTRNHDRIIVMGRRDAEMTKYVANAMLATKISFMNEVANLCDLMGVDVEHVRQGIGSDTRIGFSFIYPGAGYGGSCFPKDVKAICHMAEEHKYDALILKAVEERNQRQKSELARKVLARFGGKLAGRKIAVWGLAFKPGTDDMREAPSIRIIDELIKAGAKIAAYDPVAVDTAKAEFSPEVFGSGSLTIVEDAYAAPQDADALVLITEWKPFRNPDFGRLKKIMKTAIVFDGRNQYDPEHVKGIGFEYYGIGRR